MASAIVREKKRMTDIPCSSVQRRKRSVGRFMGTVLKVPGVLVIGAVRRHARCEAYRPS